MLCKFISWNKGKQNVKFQIEDIHIYKIHHFDIGQTGNFSITIQEILDNQSNTCSHHHFVNLHVQVSNCKFNIINSNVYF